MKEVLGLQQGPTSGAVPRTRVVVMLLGVEKLGAVEQLMVTNLMGLVWTGVEERLDGCVWLGLVGVIVWNTSSRLSSSSSLGELEMLAIGDTSDIWVSHFLSL